MDQRYVIGIDIGGTSAGVGLVGPEGEILAEKKYMTWDFPDCADFVAAVKEGIDEMTGQKTMASLCGIGVGAPNGNYYTGRIEHAPNLPWKGVVDLAGMMEKAMGVPVVLTNDANAAALGEKQFGAAKGMTDFVVITIGTGLGSGVVCNGSLIYGHSGFAGELGHTCAVPDGRLCTCGKHGCLETYVSARGLKQTFVEILARDGNGSSLKDRDPRDISAYDIFNAAMSGDPAAREAFDFTGRILGHHLADLTAITSPEAIFLYGGVTASGDLILKPTREAMEENLLKVFRGRVRVELSELGGKSAAILGAAALAWDVLCNEDEDEPA
jgi:glucokinase